MGICRKRGAFAMKKRACGVFLIAILLAAGVFSACKSKPAALAPQDQQELQQTAPTEPAQVPSQSAQTSLQPLTRELIILALNNGVDINYWQYYISDGFTLESEKTSQRITNNSKGEVTLEDNSTHETIRIHQGLPVKSNGDVRNREGSPWSISVNVSSDPGQFLRFIENANGYFALAFNEATKKLSFGGADYTVQFSSLPYLQIRLAEPRKSGRDNVIDLQGASVGTTGQ
jgi:hypothetical protein